MNPLTKLKKLADVLSKVSYDPEQLKMLLEALLPHEKDIRKMIEQRWVDDIKLDESAAFDIAPQYVPRDIAEKYSEAHLMVPYHSELEDMILKGYFSEALEHLATIPFDLEDSARSLDTQRALLVTAPKDKLIDILDLEGLTLEAAEQFGYTGDREGASEWLRANAPEKLIQSSFGDWDPGSAEEGEVVLHKVGL